MGVQPFADQQSDDQQQAEQGQRVNAFGKGRQEEQALDQAVPDVAQRSEEAFDHLRPPVVRHPMGSPGLTIAGLARR
ncbi:hypothetical protein SDC9_140165 [bioreactor metagenome]|uniref:Uncharacterized protein n=1 Tax=bioreactor metagenome TaxID=1076179 RepID=A0A645DUQ6_9ZZZZ